MAHSSSCPGWLIAFEGLDGVGKTTQARLLAANLSRAGLSVVLTQEPTAGIFGQQIRRLNRRGRRDLSPEEELALFLADRQQHVQQVIQPALAAGKIVITDRYYYSSMAYQGALGLDPEKIRKKHADFAPEPDLTILLQLPSTERSQRVEQRGRGADAFEQADYLARVAAIFDRLQAPNLIRLDGRGSKAEVQNRILSVVQRLLVRAGYSPNLVAATVNQGDEP